MPKPETEEKENQASPQDDKADGPWLQLAKSAYDQSTSFVDNNYRTKWDNNIRHWQSRHHLGSKYNKDAYKYRSKIFRPKTRSSIRSKEAAGVAAFFSNQDIVSIEPQNPNDPIQQASADVMKELINYRLGKTIPWFLICIGGIQDAMVPGVVCSIQDWEYREKQITEKYQIVNADTNEPILDEKGDPKIEIQTRSEPVIDRPVIELIPIENIRIHPGASWLDPINTSPYLIHLVPMYLIDVKAKMDNEDPKTNQPKWKKLDDGVLKSATKHVYDSTRQTREGQREDKTAQSGSGSEMGDFDIVWVHRNFIRVDDDDYVFYTLGTEHMLTDPAPIEEVYFHGERPVVMGMSVIETHKPYPSGLGEIGENIQKEINENVNQRMDVGKMVLNKRWFVKRGAQVDLRSITRNVPGSVTLMNDVTGDVKAQEFNDIPGSAFQEQDRLNLDFDELVGSFSSSTLQSNRRMNETVGGMAMIRGNSNVLTEYDLRTVAETWIERVIRQLVKLEQEYETDEVVLAIAAEKAQLFQKYGIDQVTDNLLKQELTITVNVGMGATDPIMKLQNFVTGLKAILDVITKTPANTLNVIEIAKEIFGYLGFKDGTRFFVQQMGEDPEKMEMGQVIEQLKAMIQELQSQIDNKQVESQTKLTIEDKKQEGEARRQQIKAQTDIFLKRLDLLNPVAGEKRVVNG